MDEKIYNLKEIKKEYERLGGNWLDIHSIVLQHPNMIYAIRNLAEEHFNKLLKQHRRDAVDYTNLICKKE